METAMTVFNSANRVSTSGTKMGRRFSFVQDIAGGDIRKHLKNTGLKGKKLTRAVDRVLRGDSSLGWAAFEANVSMARSRGFVPTIADLNKKETKLKIQLEAPSAVYDRDEVKEVAITTLTMEELVKLVEAKKEAEAKKAAVPV